MARPRVLVVAGHDPSGAGIDADRAALAELDVDAAFVVTAWTEQDARAVRSIGACDPDAWLEEALRVVRGRIAALKLGLLPGAAHVANAALLVDAVRADPAREVPVVLDPVIAASSGGRLLDDEGVEALRSRLCARGVIATPNLAEAAALARVPVAPLVASFDARVEAAQLLLGLGARAVVLKGGHGSEDPARDLVLEAGLRPVWLEHARIAGGKLRGSGCRFAAHLAGSLALGLGLAEAARSAGEHVAARIAAAGSREGA